MTTMTNTQHKFVDDIALQIAERAIANLTVTTALSNDLSAPWAQLIREACVAAYSAGRQHGNDEAAVLYEVTDELNNRRTANLLKSAIASSMAAAKLDYMRVNLFDAAAIFDTHELNIAQDGHVVIYTLTPREKDNVVMLNQPPTIKEKPRD